MKFPKQFRLSEESLRELSSESARTGKTETAVLEDHLAWRRLFTEEVETAVQKLAAKHKIPPRKVIEVCVLKATGQLSELPFNGLAAA